MSCWLVTADGATAVPTSAVCGLSLLQVGDRDRAGRERIPGWELIASLAPQRPGPFRVLARFDAIEDAEAALLELACLLAEEPAGVLRWAGEWCAVVHEDV